MAVFGNLIMPLVAFLQLVFAFAFIPSVYPNQAAINILKVALHATEQGTRREIEEQCTHAPWLHRTGISNKMVIMERGQGGAGRWTL